MASSLIRHRALVTPATRLAPPASTLPITARAALGDTIGRAGSATIPARRNISLTQMAPTAPNALLSVRFAMAPMTTVLSVRFRASSRLISTTSRASVVLACDSARLQQQITIPKPITAQDPTCASFAAPTAPFVQAILRHVRSALQGSICLGQCAQTPVPMAPSQATQRELDFASTATLCAWT